MKLTINEFEALLQPSEFKNLIMSSDELICTTLLVSCTLNNYRGQTTVETFKLLQLTTITTPLQVDHWQSSLKRETFSEGFGIGFNHSHQARRAMLTSALAS